MIKINEDGAIFRSYINGKIYCLTPEKSVQIQQKLGADLILVLDECTPFHVSKEYTAKSMLMSHRWAERSLNEFEKTIMASRHCMELVKAECIKIYVEKVVILSTICHFLVKQ
ncbi:MAG: hypothetical protein WBIAU1_04670 [Wolbachia endosymbiont of Drosophila biauraria]|nr:MAG: hypothetical protein WBIAU1_04670 [Wolbachia endosymbiont of Drosophila biauraria]